MKKTKRFGSGGKWSKKETKLAEPQGFMQTDLFSTPHPALDLLNQTDADELTARQALELIYKLKEAVS